MREVFAAPERTNVEENMKNSERIIAGRVAFRMQKVCRRCAVGKGKVSLQNGENPRFASADTMVV